MYYKDFVVKATALDGLNYFEPFYGNLDIVPDDIKPFYRDCNPVDVELGANGVGIRLCPADKLQELQSEYKYINALFVFATCNGDPIFINDGCVYTCVHGTPDSQHEKKAESFVDYLKSLVD